jgi:hypothetical protein
VSVPNVRFQSFREVTIEMGRFPILIFFNFCQEYVSCSKLVVIRTQNYDTHNIPCAQRLPLRPATTPVPSDCPCAQRLPLCPAIAPVPSDCPCAQRLPLRPATAPTPSDCPYAQRLPLCPETATMFSFRTGMVYNNPAKMVCSELLG